MMAEELAVVLDVAGTILRMYRVAKDLRLRILKKNVITFELIMERRCRALVVPQIDPDEVKDYCPDWPLCTLLDGRETSLEISCFSTPVTKEEAISVIQQSKAKIADLQETNQAVRVKCPKTFHTSGLIVDAERREISHIVSTGGVPFPGLTRVLRELGDLGATIHIASGDSMRSLVNLKRYGIQPERIHPVSSPRKKEEIVKNLKERYRKVIMVGDGINDIYALKAADLGVLTIQQNTHQPINLLTAADSVISDIQELPRIIMSYLSEDGRS